MNQLFDAKETNSNHYLVSEQESETACELASQTNQGRDLECLMIVRWLRFGKMIKDGSTLLSSLCKSKRSVRDFRVRFARFALILTNPGM